MLINRELQARDGRATVTNREFLYRSAFELGRHLIGYELQKVLAGVDWFVKEAGQTPAKIGVIGWGEGGMLALYAAALDPRIDAVCVSGHFDSRQDIWQQPLDRNVFGLLEQFGDAELASLIAPRPLIVEACRGPELELPSKGGAPARLVTPPLASVQAEVARAEESAHIRIDLIAVDGGHGPFGSDQALQRLLQALGLNLGPAAPGALERLRTAFDPAPRQNRQIQEIDDHNQWLLVESP